MIRIAEISGRPVAFACLQPGEDRRWGTPIDNLHVAPGTLARGIGRQILAAAIDGLPSEVRTEPIHLTVFERNERAQAVYDRWGGTVEERLDKTEPDGRLHRILRYAWPDAGRLRRRLLP